MSYIDQFVLAHQPDFVGRVRVACVQVAITVATEDPAVDGHMERLAYARQVIHQPVALSEIMAYGIAAGAGIDASVSDAKLLGEIVRLWNVYAGVGRGG